MDQDMIDALNLLFKQQEKRLEGIIDEKLKQQRKEIMLDVQILHDTEVKTNFNLLAEGQEEILRRMPDPEDAEIINGRLDVLEAVVKRLSKEVASLKKSN